MIATRPIPTHNTLPHHSAAKGILIGLALGLTAWAGLAAAAWYAMGGIG